MPEKSEERPVLFKAINIGGVTVKNRIIMPALILNFPIVGFRAGEEWKRFYSRRARGGVGAIIVGACHVHPVGRQDAHQLGADHDGWLPSLEEIAGAIKAGGSVPFLQLNHAGRYALREMIGTDPVAPSPIASRYTKQAPRELTTAEVEEIVVCFSDAAGRAMKAGFLGVELLGATGYLISQFLSPLTNQRTDRYGGDVEKRLTFAKELIQGIRGKVGDDYPIIFRLSATDHIPGGLDADDQQEVAVRLAQWGVNMINVTAGWHDAPVHQIGPSVPHGAFIPYAAGIKERISIPVSCAMRITRPEHAETAISEGQVDMVTLGRALIADPEWPVKAEKKQYRSIRYCICCCHCFDSAFARSGIECAINAELGKKDPAPAETKKRILVLGGGPAGMEAARVLASRGHDAVLVEKTGKLGGSLNLAAAPPHKKEIGNLVSYFEDALPRLGVSIRQNETVEDFAGYDGIIVATGGVAKGISVEGMDKIPCHTAEEVLAGLVELKGSVVIVGAGIVGGETAEFLCEKGVRVTMVEILNKPLMDMGPSLRWVLLERLKKAGVNIYTSSEVEEIIAEGVVVRSGDGAITVPADALVIAVGYAPNIAVLEKIKQTGIPYTVIGDSRQPRRIKNAIEEAYLAAIEWVEEL